LKIVDVREMSVPLVPSGANAVVSFDNHTVSFVALISDQRRNGKPVFGVAFNSIGRFAQSGILRERMIPRLLATPSDVLLADSGIGLDPAKVLEAIMAGEKPGGHGDRATAAAAIEMAVWDLNARLRDEPVAMTLARAAGHARHATSISVYAAGGYYSAGDGKADLQDELARYRDQGFTHFKIKIGGLPLAEDLHRVQQAVDFAGDGACIAVDANGKFDLDNALAYARALAPLQLRWFEEPADPLDYALNATVCDTYPGSVATGENLFSLADVRNLLSFGGLRGERDVLQMDPGLSYGITEYLKMIAAVEAAGFGRNQCIPHGGHLINLQVVAGLGLGGCEAYPSVFQPVGGFGDCTEIRDGQLHIGDAPGFGLEQKASLRPIIEQLVS
jgi:L-alanine-DL-glutamate epimerase-like enolase superfamily enzyme